MPEIVLFEAAGSTAGPAAADAPPAELAAELGAGACVVEIGPATVALVSDVSTVTGVPAAALLLFAADAALTPPLQAAAKTTIETRTERYIFPEFC